MPQSSQILEALRESILRVQEISKTELCTIHVKTRNERLFTTSRLSNHSKAEFIADHDDGRIFAASSMFKIFITTATLLIVEKLSASPEPNNIYRGLRGAWDRPFTDVFNQHSKDFKLNPLYGDPSLLQTSLHFNGPRNINHLLLAPDGSPLLSENEFLRNISQYSEDGHQGDINSAGWLISSDADYVLLALLIEVVSQTPLSTFLKEHIFMPLGMRCTYTSTEELSLVPIQKRPQPHMVSSNGHRKTLAFDTIHSLADTVELATTGGCMSAADIGIFFTAILEGLYGKPGDKLFGKDFCTSLLRGRTSLVRQGSGYTHLGLYTALDSDVPGSRSLNRMISPESYFSTYVLGKGHSDQRFNAYYLADPATGWASTAYFLPTIETFVIVLTNTSGPLDASDLISRLFLQEILELRPLQNGFQKVLPPLENRASSTLAEKNRAHYVALAAQMWGENALVYKKLEQDDAAPDTLSTDCPNICGRFDHEISSQSLVIDSVSGPNQKQVLRITIKTETKSSRPMRLVRKGKMFRICSLRRTGFPSLAVDCFGDWRNLEFEAEEENGVIMCLSRQGPRLKDRFIQNSRVDSDSDVGSNISCGVESLSWPDVSVASSRTSTLGNMNLEADEFIAILLRDEELKSLFTSAIQGDQVGAEKFERNFQRILEQYALDLKKEATNKQQEAAISFIRSRARYISSGVRRKFDPQNDDKENFTKLKAQLNQKGIGVDTFLEGLEPSGSGSWPPLDSPVRVGGQENENENRKMVESGAENSSSDDGATEGNHFEEPFQISLVREFMTSSQAFRLFYENFRQFVHPTFKSKLVRLIERLSGPEYADSISSSSISKLKTLVPEIEDINPSQIDVSYEEELGLLNRLKGAIEDLSGENWDWWPLKPRMRPLSPGSARLHWRCSCGEESWEEVSAIFARKLQHLSKQTFTPSTAHNPPSVQVSSTLIPQNVDVSEGLMAFTAQSSSSIRQAATFPTDNPPIASISVTIPSVTNVNTIDTAKYIFLGATAGDDLHLAQMEVHNHDDDRFFQVLRENYHRLRGVFREWLGIWKFSHCDFVKFEKSGDNEIVSRGPGIPDENNTMYHYTPKPALMPPISSRTFRHRFYTCRRRSLFCYFHKCRRPCRGSREALDRIPKRIWRLEEEGNAWELFWGLHAVERISVLKTAAYHLIVLLPSFIFWFLWLFDWGRSGDLQNGSVLF